MKSLGEQNYEPQPTDEFRKAHPEEYARLMREPGFLCLRAVKNST
jgi:hypothetical protein